MLKPSKPLVSIIIPCYNTVRFVEETIRSALAQTYENIEVIVINDGSTDNSEEVILSVKDARIHYVYQENKGLSAARNTGIKKAKGDFLTFLDADDLLLPNKTKIQIEYFSKHPSLDMVTCNFIRTNESGKHLYSITKPNKKIKLADFLKGNQIHVPSALIRKEMIAKTGFFDMTLKAAEDYDYWSRIALNKGEIFHLSQALCTYRLLDDAMTANAPRQTEMLLKVVKKNFSSSLLPDSLKYLETKAQTDTLITGAARCFVLDFFKEGKEYLKQALDLNPQLASQDFDFLSRKLAGMLVHGNVKDIAQKADKIHKEIRQDFGLSKSFAQKIVFRAELIRKKNPISLLIQPKNIRFSLEMMLAKIKR